MEEEKYEALDDSPSGESIHLFIPFELPTSSDDLEEVLLDDDENAMEMVPLGKHNLPDPELVIFQSVHDDVSDTLNEYTSATGLPITRALTCAAECGAFWKRFGVEVVIHSASFGGVGLVTGLLMKFAAADPLFSTLASNGLAVVANENAKVLFTSLMNPPGETIPEENRQTFENIKKYAFYPLAVVFSSSLSGGALWAVGDPDLGTRLALGAGTSQVGGPVTGLAHNTLRRWYGGTVVLHPDRVDVKTAMKQFYSTEPNPRDNNRPHFAGNLRNTTTRMIAITAAALGTWYSGLYFIETYCGTEGQERLDEIRNSTGSFTGDDIAAECIMGGATFLAREVVIGGIKAICLMVLQPAANRLFNTVFDYFYGPAEANEEGGVRVEEVSDDEDDDNDGDDESSTV